MSINDKTSPIVLTISGHDPSGGAGVMADAEAISHHGCHPCSILTCLTVQDSRTVHKLLPLKADDMYEQALTLLEDMPIAAIKIGLTGSIACVEAIVKLLKLHPTIPVVFDPVLACGDGTPLASQELIHRVVSDLLPLVDVLTPNTLEAAKLTGLPETAQIEDIAHALLQKGVDYLLITGGHEKGDQVTNRLFHKEQLIQILHWPRQAGEFHGTGCTLASAIAALIAKGMSIKNAVEQAQTYTHKTLEDARSLGKGQAFPKRLLIDE